MLIFIKPLNPSSEIKAIYFSMHAFNICLEKDANDETMCQFSYFISSENENGFSMGHIKEDQFRIGSEKYTNIPNLLYLSRVFWFYMRMCLECQAHKVTGALGAFCHGLNGKWIQAINWLQKSILQAFCTTPSPSRIWNGINLV
jgi:hypothetical protein